jgi:hypothetical protein
MRGSSTPGANDVGTSAVPVRTVATVVSEQQAILDPGHHSISLPFVGPFTGSAWRPVDPSNCHSRIGDSTCMEHPAGGFASDRAHRPGTFHPGNAPWRIAD